MQPIELTPELIAGIVGVILSVLFAKFPKVNTWFAGLATEAKSLIMIGLLLATTAVIALLVHFKVIQTTEPVTWLLLVRVFISTLLSNQTTYTIMPESKSVMLAKEARIERPPL